MTLVRRTNPFGELVSLRSAMDRFFDDSLFRPAGWTVSPRLALDISSTADAVVIEAALPGVKPEDVDISVLEDTLTISASTNDEKAESDDAYSYREIRRGSFSRTNFCAVSETSFKYPAERKCVRSATCPSTPTSHRT